VYLETHCNIDSKRAFPTGVLDRWHNCLLIYWRNVTQLPLPHRFFTFASWLSKTCTVTVNDCRIFGRYLSCTQLTLVKRLWIDSNGKNGDKTCRRRTIWPWVFGICNHCWVMTAWSRNTWKFCEHFCCFFWKNDPSETVATARIALKICQDQPPHNWLTLFQISF